MNIRDIDPAYAKLHGPHFNRCLPRQRQADNRAKKTGYRPRYTRAPHDNPGGSRR